MNWQVNTDASALNSLINASTTMSTTIDKEKEMEEELFKLRISHAEALANKKKDQEAEITKLMIASNRIANETDLKLKKDAAKAAAKVQLQEELKNNKQLSQAQKEAIKQEFKLRLEAELKNLDKRYAADAKMRKKLELEQARRDEKEASKKFNQAVFGAGHSFAERKAALTGAFKDESGNTNWTKGFQTLTNSLTTALSDLAKQLDQEIDSIASKKSIIDTRLQGSKNSTFMGSYWDRISKDITGAAAISPYVKQSDIASSVESMVKMGISYNVEQRAFLGAIKDKIADTFDVTNSTLRRLVRIQQQDSSAARLGMESALTSFLNNMYETTEYMSEIASSIKSSIEEASALMGATNAVTFEYQVQKWMGSLYSVGMNSSSVQSLSTALGQLASGDISGINSDSGKLLMMAANNAGLSISDMLAQGLDDSTVNTLMNSVVSYLAQIANETSDSLVVQQQMANIYGLKASDLRAAASLTSSLKNINTNGLSYSGAIQQLYNMAGTMGKRTSTGEMLTNAWANTKYSLASGIASNPALYGIYKIAGLLDSVAGGIALPDIKVMGTGVNLQTSVADLMRVASLSGGIMSSLGSIIGAGGNGGITGSGLLKAFGVGAGTSVARGTGSGLITANGASVSTSGYIGNSSSGDIIGKTTGDANAEANKTLVTAQEDSEEVTNKTMNSNIVSILTLLKDVVLGNSSLHVVMANGGLAGFN